MPVRWTGPARRFLTGPGADSHPNPSGLIALARKVAGGIVNNLKLSGNTYGYKRERIAEDAIATVTVTNNIPGAEPIVDISIEVAEGPIEEDEKFPCLKGIVVGWPSWVNSGEFGYQPTLLEPSIFTVESPDDELRFNTLVYEVEDREIITAATGSYKRHHREGLSVGVLDWQGRGKDWVLTWQVGANHKAGEAGLSALRARSLPASGQVFFCGEVKATVPFNQQVLGAGIEERAEVDYLNVVTRDVSGSDTLLRFLTRPWSDDEAAFETVSSISVAYDADTTQPFFFNASGNTAVGIAQRHVVWSPLAATGEPWQDPFRGEVSVISSSVFLEYQLSSSGDTQLTEQRLDNYAISPDMNGGFTVERHPNLGSESNFPSATPVTTVTLAVDWKGDSLTRCTFTALEAASILTFNWSDSAPDGVFTGDDSGTYTGSMRDALIEFENSQLESFHAMEIVSSEGDYNLTEFIDSTFEGSSFHQSQSQHRGITFLDLRFDLIGLSQTNIDTTITKLTEFSVDPARTIDVTWELKQGATLLDTFSEPTFTQTLWDGDGIGSGTPVDPIRLPDMWSATIGYFSGNLELFHNFLFQDTLYASKDGQFFYQGVMRFPSANIFAAVPLGLPFVDRETRMASYDGNITAYWHNTGQRILDQVDQTNYTAAAYQGQSASVAKMRTPFASGELNVLIGVSGGLGFDYAITTEPRNIGLLSIL